MPIYDVKVHGVTKQGYPITITCSPDRNESLTDAMKQIAQFLDKMGIKPAPPNIMGVPIPSPAQVETKECPIHHVPMQKRQKGNAVWYSHKVVEPDGREWWCKGEVK